MKLRLLIASFFLTNLLFSQNFHDTQGKLDISNSGQASYTLPIAMPPSLKSVGPVLNLTYSSGQFGGIAGQGWGISSISNISRIASRKDVDGYIDGVDFDSNDMLALDGQRLILKSGGNYWDNGSVYQTEVQSNTKIELFGSGASTYFIVTAPDGSRSWYGNYGGMDATDLTAFYIVRFEDTDGDYITYHYTKPFNASLCISEIKFSANINGLTPLNLIKFNYKAAIRTESAYIKGIKHQKSAILDYIEVKTNNQLFRKYQLTHSIDTQLGYEKISQIQEFNRNLEPANPINFDYQNTQTQALGSEYITSYNNNLNFAEVQATGDFDGDGRLDFITEDQLFKNLFTGASGEIPVNLNLGVGKKMAVTTINNGVMNQSNSILSVVPNASSTEFKIYNLQGNSIAYNYSKTININNTFTVSNTSQNVLYGGPPNSSWSTEECDSDENLNGVKNSSEYYEGDFNGDGISEIIIVNSIGEHHLRATKKYRTAAGLPLGEACALTLTKSSFETFWLDLNPLVQTEYDGLKNLNFPEFNHDNKKHVMDFNGDGKSEILLINSDKTYKIIAIKQLLQSPWIETEILGSGSIDEYSETKQILFGDFNGDGKADLILPDTEGGENHILWHIYYSNPNPSGGAFFVKESHNIVEYRPTTGTAYQSQVHNSSYYALDTNGDGKSDILRVRREKYSTTLDGNNTKWRAMTYVNNIGNTAVTGDKFTADYISPTLHDSDSPDPVIPVVSTYRHNGLNKELLIIRNHHNSLTYVDFTKDVSKDIRITKVTSSGGNIVDEISYQPMQPTTATTNGLGNLNDFYSSANSVNYPYVEIKRLPTSYLVSQLKNTTEGIVKYQGFRYHGLVANMYGLGIIGFNKVARSAWFQNVTDKTVWNVMETNPLWRGGVKRSYTQLLNSVNSFSFVSSGNPSGIVNSTVNDFVYNTIGNVYNIYLNNKTITDFQTGVSTTEDYSYDPTYLLPTGTVTKNFLNSVLQGTATTTNTFENNASGTGSYYYIGRPLSTKSIVDAYSNTFETTDNYYYTNNRLTKTTKKGNTLESKYLVEEFEYDIYGNIKKKTVSSQGYSAPFIAPRVIEYTYDATGRFIKTTKDVEGLISTNNTYDPIYGSVLVSTNPYSQATTTEIDNWGKVKKVTDFLGKSITYSYSKSGNEYTVSKIGDDGSGSIEVSDALGRIKKAGSKNIDNTWSYKNIEYDFIGRKYRESEPYSSGSPSLWNTTLFDDYNRIKQSTNSTGLVTNITYSGLTVTANDGIKTTSSTKNANGHVVAATDAGGTITYAYYANGNLKESNYEGTIISMVYDEWGRKKQLTDPSAGTYTYSYYPSGETRTETTPKGTTTYTYNAVGKLINKSVEGDLISQMTDYLYNSTTKLLSMADFWDNATGYGSTTEYFYDSAKRLSSTYENTPETLFEKEIQYDEFGRVFREFTKATHHATGKNSGKWIKYIYKNGYQWQILDDATSQILWQTNTVNAKGQLTSASLGNGINITKTYDNYGFATQFKYDRTGSSPANILTLNTTFNPQRGNLTNRYNSMFNWTENFQYDNLDRLTHYTNTQGIQEEQTYDNKGRIEQNSIGEYNYSNTNKAYQNTSIDITSEAEAYYANRQGIFNDSMEDQKGWTTYYNPTQMGYDSNQTHTGEYSIKLSNPTLSEIMVFSETRVAIDNAQDTQYTYSAWVYSDGAQAEMFLYMDTQNVQNSFLAVDQVQTNATGQWVKIEKTVTVPASMKFLSLRLDNNGYGTVWFDDVRIRKTSIPETTPKELNITYNSFKGPVQIEETGVDKISFTYNPSGQRTGMYYGGIQNSMEQRENRKHYLNNGQIEVKYNTKTGAVEFMTYIGGDGYSSPVILKSDGTTQQYLYLHRDYQGSILAITNQSGNVIEKRLFDAWGNIVKVQDAQGNNLTKLTVLDRGYTGHEHLQSVGLIHMNGRLYDPKLHRFLQPDNFVQEPHNTQNYNRYGYVLNNPLKYTDVSGEEFTLLAAIAVGAIISATTYTLTAVFSNSPLTLGGFAKATFIGALSGAVTFGIGNYATTICEFGNRLTFQALAHGSFQGLVTGVQGGNPIVGFASGALSSIVSSLWSGGYINNTDSAWKGVGGAWGSRNFGTVAFGTISGGAGAALTGGNFWQGAATGFGVSLLNHAFHEINNRKLIDSRLEANGYDPDATAEIYQSQLNGFAEKIFPDLMEKLDYPTFALKDRIISQDGSSGKAYGITRPTLIDGQYRVKSDVEISRSALESYRLLAATIGHELNHVFHFNTGLFDKWNKKYGYEKAMAMTEWAAHTWEAKVGGYPTQSIINDNYKIMIKF